MTRREAGFTKRIFGALLAGLTMQVISLRALADSNFDFLYIGRLTQTSGQPVAGPVSLQISFYHTASGGDPVLKVTSGLEQTPLVDGIFQVKLDLSPSAYSSVFSDPLQPVYVQVTDLTNAPRSPYPLQQIDMVPYAAKVPVDGTSVQIDASGRLSVGPSSAPGNNQFLTREANGSWVWASPSSSSAGLSGGSSAPSLAYTGTNTNIPAYQVLQAGPSGTETFGPLNISQSAAVTGILPVARGGTNSGTALSNNRLMMSASGAITEGPALTNGQIMIGASGAAPVAATLSAGSGIAIANGSGSVTISATGGGGGGSSPSFQAVSANYTLVAGDANKVFQVSNAVTLTLPAVASVAAGYSVTFKVLGTSPVFVAAAGGDTIDINTLKVGLPGQFDVFTVASDGTVWNTIAAPTDINRYAQAVLCGDAGNSCYTNAAAIAALSATTPLGKNLVWTATRDGSIWQELGGYRILATSGLDAWQMQLNADGKSYSANAFLNNPAIIAGIVCPTNVYLNDSSVYTTNHCLYYDIGSSPAAALNGAGNSQTVAGSYGLDNTSPRAWYSGNIQGCVNEGMRLPVLFESAAGQAIIQSAVAQGAYASTFPFTGTENGTGGTYIPSAAGYFWTATPYGAIAYWVANSSNGLAAPATVNPVVCALP